MLVLNFPGWLILVAVPVWLVAVYKRSLVSLLLVAILGLLLGNYRGAGYERQLENYQSYYGQSVTLQVIAQDDAVYAAHSQLSFTGSSVNLGGKELTGKLQLSGFGLPAVYQGDEVTVSGKLMSALGSYQGRVSFAKLQLIAHHTSVVATMRRKFTAGLNSALPEPAASFALGLLIGQRTTLPDEVKQDLLMVGLTHIVAVSGYNLTIILHASQRLLARRSKRLTTGLSLGLMVFFVLLTGASASIIRAAVVSTLSIVASYYGRRFKPLNLLALAAAITAWFSPFYIWGDASWYLSFLAFFGILVLAPPLQNKLPERWRHSLLVGVALESVCAEIMTLPYVLYSFGQMSLVGLPANVLVVALVPLAMLLSTIAGLAGMLLPTLTGWLAWPGKLVLDYMLGVAHLIAGLPHVFLQNLGLSLDKMLGLYAVLTGVSSLLYRKTKVPIYAKITDKNERTQQMVDYQAAESG